MDNNSTDTVLCNVCLMRVHRNVYDEHVSSHSQPYDLFGSILDLSSVIAEINQRYNQRPQTSFPPRTNPQPATAPRLTAELISSGLRTSLGISRLLQQYSQSENENILNPPSNFLQNFATITDTLIPSYRETLGRGMNIEQSMQHDTTPSLHRHTLLPSSSVPYTYHPINAYPQQQSQSTQRSPFNMQSSLFSLAPIALEMLASFDDDLFDNYEANLRLAERIGVVEVGVNNVDSVSTIIPRHEVSADDICAICLDNMNETLNKSNDAHVRKLICGHKYCDECILQWLAKSKKCPVCNIDLDDKVAEHKHDEPL